jgi:hypothetical protein
MTHISPLLLPRELNLEFWIIEQAAYLLYRLIFYFVFINNIIITMALQHLFELGCSAVGRTLWTEGHSVVRLLPKQGRLPTPKEDVKISTSGVRFETKTPVLERTKSLWLRPKSHGESYL